MVARKVDRLSLRQLLEPAEELLLTAVLWCTGLKDTGGFPTNSEEKGLGNLTKGEAEKLIDLYKLLAGADGTPATVTVEADGGATWNIYYPQKLAGDGCQLELLAQSTVKVDKTKRSAAHL